MHCDLAICLFVMHLSYAGNGNRHLKRIPLLLDCGHATAAIAVSENVAAVDINISVFANCFCSI